MKPLVIVDENIPGVEHYLGDLVEIRTAVGREVDRATLQGAQALLVRSVTRVDETLVAGSQLRFVGSATSGTDHVDIEYLGDAGIAFSHAPGSNANSVVEYVLSAIAAVPGKLEELLAGGQVGIIGFGIIGSLLAARLRRLGISCCAYDPWLEPSAIDNPVELAQALACDVVTIHAELTRRQPWPSFHLLGAQELSMIKPQALVINASRGPVVDNQALLNCLERGELTGPLVLDVWEGEPRISVELLRRSTLGTPHIAGYSYDGKLLATRMLCEKLADTLGLQLQVAASPDMPELFLAPTQDDAALLRQALHARYDIRQDDEALRAVSLDQPSEESAAAFDRLRRDYPRRRELAGTRISRGDFSASQRQLLRALGCELQS